jgi:hypothetical protein
VVLIAVLLQADSGKKDKKDKDKSKKDVAAEASHTPMPLFTAIRAPVAAGAAA